MFDERKEFEKQMNSNIGKPIKKLVSYWYLDNRKKEIDSQTEEYLIGDSGYCQFIFVVNPKTKKVISWKYVSDKNLCKSGKFHCGAW